MIICKKPIPVIFNDELCYCKHDKKGPFYHCKNFDELFREESNYVIKKFNLKEGNKVFFINDSYSNDTKMISSDKEFAEFIIKSSNSEQYEKAMSEIEDYDEDTCDIRLDSPETYKGLELIEYTVVEKDGYLMLVH